MRVATQCLSALSPVFFLSDFSFSIAFSRTISRFSCAPCRNDFHFWINEVQLNRNLFLFTLNPPSPPSQVPAQIHTGDCILFQFQHYIPLAEMHTISNMYTTKTNICLILENTGSVSHIWNGKSVLHIACVHVLNHLCLISRQCLKQIKILKGLHVICACLLDKCLHLDIKAWEKEFVSCNLFFFYYRVFIISQFLIVGILMYLETH